MAKYNIDWGIANNHDTRSGGETPDNTKWFQGTGHSWHEATETTSVNYGTIETYGAYIKITVTYGTRVGSVKRYEGTYFKKELIKDQLINERYEYNQEEIIFYKAILGIAKNNNTSSNNSLFSTTKNNTVNMTIVHATGRKQFYISPSDAILLESEITRKIT